MASSAGIIDSTGAWGVATKYIIHFRFQKVCYLVLWINGSPHKEGCTYTALKEVADRLEANGIKTEIMYLGVKPIAGCIA